MPSDDYMLCVWPCCSSRYAPLQTRVAETERMHFVAAFLDLVHTLDMQTPTLFLGDFNGTVCPSRDYLGASSARRPTCPLLQQLLGPGAPLVDLQVALLGDENLDWTYRSVDSTGRLAASRIDLILANRAALTLVQELRVVTEVRDGGHSPVVISMRLPVVRLNWRRPRPQLPELLRCSSLELQASLEWRQLLAKWTPSSSVQAVLADAPTLSLDALSTALLSSLESLVALAGGWKCRPAARRRAYDSKEVQQLRRNLMLLHRLEDALHTFPLVPGCRPLLWARWLAALRRGGVRLPEGSLPELQVAALAATRECRVQLERCLRQMQVVRQKRWRESLPRLWRDHPGVVYGWLRGESTAWGRTPILDANGLQCATLPAVDEAVQQFWVHTVLRRHVATDGSACWSALLASEFGQHIPVVAWSRAPWTSSRVQQVLASMREAAAPGPLGIPLAVWKSMPEAWLAALAQMFQLVEEEGRWPTAWVRAYVTMIPKAAGGSRPEDQRPITVLDLPYRVWAKGIVLHWTPTLQKAYLGDAAMGFRAQSGTTHVVQLLQDLMALQRRRRKELWLASFDIKKCYDMLPWWRSLAWHGALVFLRRSSAASRPSTISCSGVSATARWTVLCSKRQMGRRRDALPVRISSTCWRLFTAGHEWRAMAWWWDPSLCLPLVMLTTWRWWLAAWMR